MSAVVNIAIKRDKERFKRMADELRRFADDVESGKIHAAAWIYVFDDPAVGRACDYSYFKSPCASDAELAEAMAMTVCNLGKEDEFDEPE